eukprot:713690-Pleurochrysis_carterae.AAC.2
MGIASIDAPVGTANKRLAPARNCRGRWPPRRPRSCSPAPELPPARPPLTVQESLLEEPVKGHLTNDKGVASRQKLLEDERSMASRGETRLESTATS